MKLQQLYAYVYSPQSILPKEAKYTAEMTEAQKVIIAEKRADRIRKKQEKASTDAQIDIATPEQVETEPRQAKHAERLEKIKEAFEVITNGSETKAFRALLRELRNGDLETLLYGNATDELETEYVMPDEDGILEQFKALNQEYGYFTKEKQAYSVFSILFKACKLSADFVENNPDDAEASLRAYKMMVVFSLNAKNPCQAIDKFIDTHGRDIAGEPFRNPIHDTLVLGIPKYQDFASDLPKNKAEIFLMDWRNLIMQHGCQLLVLFQQSPVINKFLAGNKNLSLDNIQAAAARVQYTNHEKHPELAKLCVRYNVSEDTFNKCLEIKPIEQDFLPDLVVVDEKYPGYYLVKLPKDDYHAYLLGHLTGCCQSIGGHSETVVVDGITRKNNGFYVFVRAKSGSENQPLMVGNRINYKHYEIVGQFYAWLTEGDNLAIDSLENRTPSRDDEIAVALLEQFAVQCFIERPDMTLITIGQGGKTPDKYRNSTSTPYPERMLEGIQYPDSYNQAIVAISPFCLALGKQINTTLANLSINSVFELYSKTEAEWFNILLTSIEYYNRKLGADSLKKLLDKTLDQHQFLRIVTLLLEANALTQATCTAILSMYPRTALDFAEALYILSKAKPSLLSENVFLELIIPEKAYVPSVIIKLNEQNPELINEENFNLITRDQQLACDLYTFLRAYTAKTKKSFFTQDNFPLLVTCLRKAHNGPGNAPTLISELCDYFRISYQAANAYLKILSNSENIIAQVAVLLNVLHSDIKTPPTDMELALVDDIARRNDWYIALTFSLLLKNNRACFTIDNFNILCANSKNAIHIPGIINSLIMKQPHLINDTNIKLLLNHRNYPAITNYQFFLFAIGSPQHTNESFKAFVDSLLPPSAPAQVGAGNLGLFGGVADVPADSNTTAPGNKGAGNAW